MVMENMLAYAEIDEILNLLEDMTISDTGTISTSTNSKEKIPIGQELKQ